MFNITVGPLVDQPVPPADDPGRRDWVQGIKAVLDKAVDMLLNLAVAAAFTVTAVQLAAEHAVTETAEAAGRALEYAGQAWPSLVAVGAVALQAAVGVSVAKQAWDSVRSARAEAAAAARFDDRDRVVSPSHREHEAPDPASQPQRPADQDWGAADPREVSQTSVYGESPRLRRVDDRQPVDDQVASDRQQVSRTTPLGGQPYERLAQEPDQTGTATPPVPVREGHTRRTRLDAGNDHGDMDEFQEFTSEQRPPSSPRTVASIDSVSRSEPAAPSKPGVVSGPGNRSQLPQRVVRPGDADGRPANHQAHSRSMNMGPSPKQTLPQSAIDKELGSDESHRERGSGGAPSAR